jgi:RHS repeat-associated protein
MRTNSDPAQYLLTDHLGSTSLAVTIKRGIATISAENRTMPWGEVRYCSGTMPTDYTYTGQKNAPEIGLMFYNARWYDPAIGHFTQADTLIPGAGSPQAWDRYAYVFNNPMIYTDPSGHAICLDGGSQCYSQEQRKCFGSSETINQLIRDITDQFGWTFKDFWTRDQLSEVRQAGWDIKNYIGGLGENGEEWIREYLGKAVFHDEILANDMLGAAAFVPTRNHIFFKDEGKNSTSIVHELGHVLDNYFGEYLAPPAVYFGGGAADMLVEFLGGTTNGLRFLGPLEIQEEYLFPPDNQTNRHGNKAPAEYFATHFEFQVTGYPSNYNNSKADLWVKTFISVTVNLLP